LARDSHERSFEAVPSRGGKNRFSASDKYPDGRRAAVFLFFSHFWFQKRWGRTAEVLISQLSGQRDEKRKKKKVFDSLLTLISGGGKKGEEKPSNRAIH